MYINKLPLQTNGSGMPGVELSYGTSIGPILAISVTTPYCNVLHLLYTDYVKTGHCVQIKLMIKTVMHKC